uniref:suppressor of cytokine signaling 7-like isoform X1 n=1 Tax=Oncorhynchus gorbuscha TaxID=8017 RepID=UPI001EAF8213|nr:suppressor of cytokine signaling 7-like isoform X1 [Oncorhynchus gorbuscha]XP_046161873.1 suppressor of cytokine signaling 7-like isoform X1 [Oncorhynchus gorbuscha]
MNNAQDMSPDFVLMRLVSAAEYDRLDEENLTLGGGVVSGFGKAVLGNHGNNINNGFEFDRNNPTAGPGIPNNPSPHYSSQVESWTGAPDSRLMLTRPLVSDAPQPPDFAVAQRFDFPHGAGRGSRAQLMVFQNVLRTSDGVLECGLEQPSGFQVSEADKQEASSACVMMTGDNNMDVQHQRLQWHPIMKLSKMVADAGDLSGEGDGLCHRHRLVTDAMDWPPLLDKSLRFCILDPKKTCSTGDTIYHHLDDTVLNLARRLGELGQASEMLLKEGGEVPRCSCQSILASATGGIGPGEDPSETSDALLVLEGLDSEEVGELGGEEFKGGAPGQEGVTDMGQDRRGTFSSGSLTGLMRQVHRLAGESCACDPQVCPSPLDALGSAAALTSSLSLASSNITGQPATEASATLSGTLPSQDPPSQTSQPQSRVTTPKLGMMLRAASPVVVEGAAGGEKTTRGKSRKGSLKIRLSKLFRTKSSSGSSHLLDKRPSLASSTSSGGSLVDVWGSGSTSIDLDTGRKHQLSRPQSAFSPLAFGPAFTGETVSLEDVDISRRGVNSLHPPTPPPPPRRSLSLLDDFGGPQPGPFLESGVHPSHAFIQHSLSLNDTFLRGLPRPIPLPGDGQNPSRVDQRPLLCPLSRPDASSFATSLRELEKCGWYWGPMNWEDAEMKLKAKPDGAFLVRDSSDPRYILSLSFRSQGVTHHTRMEHYRGTFSLWCHPKFEDRCHSVVEFIERAIMHSKNGKFLYFLRSRVPGLPPTPVQLLYPVSRFSSVKSLQHLCRFCIRQMIRIDHIQELPLPTPLIVYLRKFYYYDPEEEMYMSIKEMGRDMTTQPATGQPESQT